MNVIESVKEYYGKTLSSNKDLKTNACTTPCQKMQPQFLEALKRIHETIIEKYYGCGLCIPDCLVNCHVLDLGCGAGRDCYILSQFVGEKGKVIGLDMTEEQIQVAKQFEMEQAAKFGYDQPNTEFLLGYIETPIDAGVKEESIDVIISNCVINLSPDKKAVLTEAYKALKVGGELNFSDMYCDREVTAEVKNNEVLWGEGIAGALPWKELHRLAAQIGFSQPRLISASKITIDEKFEGILGDSKFISATYRLFKLPTDVSCLTHGGKTQVIYEGGIQHLGETFQFDCQNNFQKDDVSCVDEELAQILMYSRFSKYFTVKPLKGSRQNDLKASADLDFSKILDPFDWLNSKEVTSS